MRESRLMKAIADLRRLTDRSRQARATALKNAVSENEKAYQQSMLDLYDGLLTMIDQHSGAAEMAHETELNRVETAQTGCVN